MTLLAWHFGRDDRTLDFGDGREIRPGVEFRVEPPLALCQRGLHASERAIDALTYCRGEYLSRVELDGEILRDTDKACATIRRHLWCADAGETLRAFARWCALEVIRLWNAPEVVRRYLKTGDESIHEEAAEAAAEAAARVSRAAAEAAEAAATRAAASRAAWAAAWEAAEAAEAAAAWASDAAAAAARAAWAAMKAAAAARAAWAAMKAAMEAVRTKQNDRLTAMLMELAPKVEP